MLRKGGDEGGVVVGVGRKERRGIELEVIRLPSLGDSVCFEQVFVGFDTFFDRIHLQRDNGSALGLQLHLNFPLEAKICPRRVLGLRPISSSLQIACRLREVDEERIIP